MPSFQYVGHSGETIVGMLPQDLSEEDYDALDYAHQQAVLINKGSDGGLLYQEIRQQAPQDFMYGQPNVLTDAPATTPFEYGAADAPASVEIPDSSQPAEPAAAAPEPNPNPPLDQAPAEGAN